MVELLQKLGRSNGRESGMFGGGMALTAVIFLLDVLVQNRVKCFRVHILVNQKQKKAASVQKRLC